MAHTLEYNKECSLDGVEQRFHFPKTTDACNRFACTQMQQPAPTFAMLYKFLRDCGVNESMIHYVHTMRDMEEYTGDFDIVVTAEDTYIERIASN